MICEILDTTSQESRGCVWDMVDMNDTTTSVSPLRSYSSAALSLYDCVENDEDEWFRILSSEHARYGYTYRVNA
jgi:hypothetical protein